MTITPNNDRPSNVFSLVKRYMKFFLVRYQGLHIYGKIAIWCIILFDTAIAAAIIIITPARIFQALYDFAEKLASLPFGWLVLASAIVVVSYPPMIGHTTIATLCGFAYGMKGSIIAIAASVIGSALVFITLRLLFSHRLRHWASKNEKWQALEAVRAKGLPLMILIRISPFPPWVWSNTLFASIQPVKLWQFVTATLFLSPKLCLHVFIGSRMAELSDGEHRSQMDTRTKIMNGVFIGGGILVAIFTSWLVYTLVQSHIRTLQGIPTDVDEQAADAIEDFDEEAPLLNSREDTSSTTH
ncbi:Golgi apparatus membrane protein TVP38 [Dendrothele bispora CBS 962.96]|uniref:Golgi apparatus membrane protein TVP38 n=1 Tax=Dendrothele bispora (strain CBS 962.96) TaxID=1314807 RepID=A0A4S8MZ09_DENBC|nr:Golgi apparatus membrane protein TVP38 [Dendrothele bispora CBS 962.96]